MKKANRWLPLLMLLPLVGCYAYGPVPVAEVTPGAAVRARITAEEAERLRSILGREDRLLSGRVREATPDHLLLDVPSATVTAGTSTEWLTQGISIPRPQLLELEVRRLDRWKTAGVVALGVVVAGVLAAETFDRPPGAPPIGPGRGGGDAWIGVAGWRP